MANPWSAFYWSDYDSKTAHLTLAEDGAYRRLLSHYYRTGRPLPANAEILLRVCRAFADSEKAAVTAVLAEFFTVEADGYHNKRADEELLKANQVSEKRRDAGKKGASVTNGKKSANGSANDPANERQMTTQPQPHKYIEREIVPDGDLDEKVRAVFREHPANDHIRDRIELPREQAEAIFDALAADGFDLVLTGTRNLNAAVARWPRDQLRYVPNPVKFFRKQEYRLDPVMWEKSEPQEQSRGKQPAVSASIARDERNRDRILDVFTRGSSRNAAPGVVVKKV